MSDVHEPFLTFFIEEDKLVFSKTWGYHAHPAGISIEVIRAKYLHNSTATTRQYLGIEQRDVSNAYDTVNL